MSNNEYNLIRIEALENKIEELETQLKLENENKRRIVTELEVELDKMIKPPTKFKKINKWKANQPQ